MRRICQAFLVFAIGASLAGTVPLRAQAEAATVQQGAVSVQGMQRSYVIYFPKPFDAGKRYPVLMVLHGGEGDGSGMASRTGIDGYVDQEQFIAVLPNAGGDQWNDGRETTQSERDDVAFVRAVVQDVVQRLNGDPARVFVAGGSNGGMMTQRLACDASEVFAGFAAVTANMPAGLAGKCRPARPAPFLFIYGTDDPIMPPAGGDIKAGRRQGAGGRVISAADTVKFWAGVDGCSSEQDQELPDKVDDGTSVRARTFQGCAAPVLVYEVKGGGHSWPGMAPPQRAMIRRLIGNTSQEINATAAIVSFFKQFGL